MKNEISYLASILEEDEEKSRNIINIRDSSEISSCSTRPSIGNQVDGLPIVFSTEAVAASPELKVPAPIRALAPRNLKIERNYELLCWYGLYKF